MAGTDDATTLPTACPSAHGRTIFGVRNPDVAGLAGRVLRLPMTIFAALAQHRGATHRLLCGTATTVVLASAAGALWPPLRLPVFIGVGCGYCARLLADACTPHGAPLLGPSVPATSTCCHPGCA